MIKKYCQNIMFICSLLIISVTAVAAPSKSLWPRWTANNAHSTQVINHQLFQDFLDHYVYTDAEGINLVHYSQVSVKDKQALNYYLDQLSQVKIDQYNRNEQLAYWINLYNALTIKTVLDHYPVKSILDIKLSGFFTPGPWDAKLIKVENIPLSLNDIEHRIIRPIWNDPRTHYTLNCASYSCPNLSKQVYIGEKINSLLTKAATGYVNSSRGVMIQGKNLTVSKIYDWYQEDFGGNEQAVINHLILYASPSLKQQLLKFHQISAYDYHWQLNGN